MKIKLRLSSVVVAAVCGTLPAMAQQSAPNDYSRANVSQNQNQNGQYQRLGKLEQANKVIGMEVKDAQDQKLGKVRELAVDLKNGRIVEVIVGTGGVLGVDEQLTAVPPAAFHCNEAEKALTLDTDTARFKTAPNFKMSEWDATVNPDHVTEIYTYYGTPAYFTTGAADQNAANNNETPAHPAERQSLARTSNPAMCHLGDIQRASKIIGTPVRNTQDQRIGNAENLVVDLPAGRVVEVIVASGGFLGMGDELSAIPPQAFHTSASPDTLVLDTTKEALTSAPHFKASEWAQANNPDDVSAVYRAYNIQPYFGTNAVENATHDVDSTAQNVRDRDGNTLTPINQGTSAADVQTTREIRKEIMAASGLSIDAQNVKVITVNGHVTLRGPVKSEEERRQIGDIANRVAAAGNVDNQLQVEAIAPTTSTR